MGKGEELILFEKNSNLFSTSYSNSKKQNGGKQTKQMEELRRRILPDTDEELAKFISLFQKGEMPASESGMERHFELAKEKPNAFYNHGVVLALSFGGTNTKVMLASMKDGQIMVNFMSMQKKIRNSTRNLTTIWINCF